MIGRGSHVVRGGRKVGMAPALLALALVLALAAGCTSAAGGDGPQPDRIQARPGEEFTITLESNPSTGYSWQLAAPLDERVVTLVGSEYQNRESGQVGAGGQETWTFRAVAEGEAKIELAYARPFEEDQPPEATATFVVVR